MINWYIRNILGWAAFVFLAIFLFVVGWDYVTTRINTLEARIHELEVKPRPLVVAERYSSVYLMGEKVKPEEKDHATDPQENMPWLY